MSFVRNPGANPTASPPPASSWTVFNAGDSAAVTDDPVLGLNFSRAGLGSPISITGFTQPTPGASGFSVRAGMVVNSGVTSPVGAGQLSGACLVISDGTKIVEFGYNVNSGGTFFEVNRWTNSTTFSTAQTLLYTPDSAWRSRMQQYEPFYLHIIVSASAISWYLSRVGRIDQAFLIYTESLAAYLGTISTVGISMRGRANGGAAVPTKAWLFDWQLG